MEKSLGHLILHMAFLILNNKIFSYFSVENDLILDQCTITHSSDNRSFISLFLSRKHPSECMLSRTSGSMSSAEGTLRIATFRGTGCSGSGSFFPPLKRAEANQWYETLPLRLAATQRDIQRQVLYMFEIFFYHQLQVTIIVWERTVWTFC